MGKAERQEPVNYKMSWKGKRKLRELNDQKNNLELK
jgi:hypothetical protein